MKCTECGKPDAKRDRKIIAMGNTRWTAFCGPECRGTFWERKRQYAEETAKRPDPFRPR